MGIFENLGHVLQQARTGQASESDVHAAYDQVAQAVPPDQLAGGLAHAFKSEETPPFPSMLAQLFGRSNPEQKSGLLNTLLGRLSPAERSRTLGSDVAAASGGNVTPQQAQQIPPEKVEQLAQHAEQKDPSIVDQAARFYAQHPQLIKTIGAGALAVMLARISPLRH